MDRSHIVVDAFAGAKGEETPRAFTHGGNRRTVTEIVTRWYTETHCYFRLQADDGHRYVLRYDLDQSDLGTRDGRNDRRRDVGAKKKRPAGAGLCSDRMWRLTISRP